MALNYVIKKGDSLRKIAKGFYGDPSLSKKLADYNGILNPDLIVVGQNMEVPSKSELLGEVIEPPTPDGSSDNKTSLATPNGLEEILSTFGNIFQFMTDDGRLDPHWESKHLGRAPLPFPMALSWDLSQGVTKLYCHKKLVEIFPEVFAKIEKKGLKSKIRTFGGCYNYRPKRTSGKLSTHSWGIGIDLNPETNPQGRPGDMHPGVVEIFREFGFKWGGDWSGKSKDPMHFQFCTGY
ncbi:MAG: M15 family metallopeptidase [Thermodesulfobacteriota bacterium]